MDEASIMAGHPLRERRENLEAWSSKEQKVPRFVVNHGGIY